MAAKALGDIMSSNLGPLGNYKMLMSGGGDIKITKDGNVLLKEMQIQHPTASILARAAVAQDIVTGDGTTSSIMIIGEIMKKAELLVSDGIHPRSLVDGLDLAKTWSLEFLDLFKINFDDIASNRELLSNVVLTSLNSKLNRTLAKHMQNIIVDSIFCIMQKKQNNYMPVSDTGLDLHMIEIMPIKFGLQTETQFIKGMVMDHGCRHPNMPKKLKNCYVLTCNVSLEYEKTEVNSSFLYSNAEQKQLFAEAERRYTDNKVNKIIELKNKVCNEQNNKNFVVFNQKGIDPKALDMLAKAGIMALRRVKRRNMERLTLCCGGHAVNSVEDLTERDLGFANDVWEMTIQDEKYTFVEGVEDPRSCCILIKAPTDYEIEQIKDAVRDGLRVCRNAIADKCLIPGAGSFELACSDYLTEKSKIEISNKTRYGVELFADALMSITKGIIKNAEEDHADIISNLAQKYQILKKDCNGKYNNADIAYDVINKVICKPSAVNIWDNYIVKKQLIELTITLATQLVLIDEIIRAGKSMKQ